VRMLAGLIHIAFKIASRGAAHGRGHSNTKTTGRYDRRNDDVTLTKWSGSGFSTSCA
jgi:hypothetical protein